MEITVRPATAADVPALCALLSLLFAQEADFTPDPDRQTRALNLILAQPETGQILCATDGDVVVGMVSLLYTISTAKGGRAAWMEDLITHPDRRGQGIGGQLLQAVIQGARAAGCLRLTVLTDATNHPAMRFYERASFTRSQMVPFRLNL